MAPDANGAMRKIPEEVRIEPGWALARFGDGGWWPAIERGLQGGAFARGRVRRSRTCSGGRGATGSRLCPPSASARSRPAGRSLAEARRPIRKAHRSPTSGRHSGDGQRRPAGRERPWRVQSCTPPPVPDVLLDDTRGSGWTLAMVGGQLRRAGAARVVPLVLGTLQ